jgi:hypothetical protein
MSTIKSSAENLTLNADGAAKDIKFQANGVEKASISSTGAFTSTSIDATKLSGALPAIDGSALTGSGGLKSQQVFTASGTWTKPAGITKIKVIVTGGGGGGCAVNSDDTAGGGGAGATAIKIIDVSAVTSVSVTVGAGQAGKVNNGGNSVNYGNPSSFGSYCTAGAGSNGSGGWWSLGGTGGTATGGDINLPGGDGNGGHIDQVTPYETSGTGGSSFWGGGGRGSSRSAGAAGDNAGKAPGSGGGASAITGTGSAGAAGIVVIEEYK